MDDTSKYLIHAEVEADGVVERSDVVGAIFGQTEGLLGDDLDLRDLREAQRVGRIDVQISSSSGVTRGHLTIATGLDKVETATLAAALETIDQVGPCRATLTITTIEDVRAAKRKTVVDRAKELLRTGFEDTVMSSDEILDEVREQVKVERITEYEGLPAGPNVTEGDAIIVVEGRSDVLTLLKYGIKNALAVEGTDVPDAVAELTRHRTVTAFLDGDRGGDLIFRELSQVGELDFVAFAPAGTSVEDLDHPEVFAALENKVPADDITDSTAPRDVVAATDGSATPAPSPAREPEAPPAGPEETPTEPESAAGEPTSIYDHVAMVVDEGTGEARLLDEAGDPIDDVPVDAVYETLESIEQSPHTVVMDGILEQRLLDLAAQQGVQRIIAAALGQFTKQPTGVETHAADNVADSSPSQ